MKDLRILHCHYHCCCCEVDMVAVQVILVVGDRSQQPGNATIFFKICNTIFRVGRKFRYGRKTGNIHVIGFGLMYMMQILYI